MPRQLWLADAARDAGLKVVEVHGWKTRGSSSFWPKGLVVHHTATPSKVTGDMPTLRVLSDGHARLSGPLAQYGLGRSGTVYVVAAGKANHAGAGGWEGLSGNSSVFGIEAEHSGDPDEPWPSAQLDAYYRLSAAILDRIDAGTEMCCGHKEWATPKGRKVDPVSINMDQFRREVARANDNEDDMPLTSSDYKGIIKAVWVDARAGRGDRAKPTIQLLGEAARDAAGAKAQAAACLALVRKMAAGDTLTDDQIVASVDGAVEDALKDAVITVDINTGA